MRFRRIPSLGGDYIQLKQRIHNLERIVQAIGFSPDFPYTLTVNDGTRNRVEIGKINGSYGIKIINNAGATIVFADGHITADGITVGTLDASIVNVTNLTASNITTGTLNASIVDVININATNINTGALNADLITTGHMDGDRITSRSIEADRLEAYSITAEELSTGEIITQSAQIKEALITNAHISDLNAGKINVGTLDVVTLNLNGLNLNGYLGIGGANQPSYMYISRGGDYNQNCYLRFEGGSKMWSDTSDRIGINSLGSPMYIYVNSYERLVLAAVGQNVMRGGLQVTTGPDDDDLGRVNIEGDTRVNGKFYLGENTAGYWHFNGNEYELEGNLRVNGYQTFRSTLYMNDHDIADVDTISAYTFHERSAIFTGDNYREIVESVKPNRKKKKTKRTKKLGKNWEELDHASLYPSIAGESESGEKTMSLSGLVMVHNKTLIELMKKVENLERNLA